MAAAQPEHLGHVRVLEEEPSAYLVILFIERTASDEDAYAIAGSHVSILCWFPVAIRICILAILACAASFAEDSYLFTSFRGNGETGVYLAVSRDGRKWTPLNEDKPWIKPEQAGMLMRDPFLIRGPDKIWHMLWTWGWARKETGGTLKIGYASSRDLLTWTPQREIPLFQNEPTARNAWAPEAAWDEKRKEWVLFWATTIPGRFPDTEETGDSGYNHRLYSVTTRDWRHFTPEKLWFDPGFNSIDSTLVYDGKRWIMVFKDERRNPIQKRLRLAFSDSPQGPWKDVTEPFTKDWVEGPTVMKIDREWWIYFDHYSKPQHYGGVRTRNWKTFEDITGQVSFPVGHRHGTVVKLSAQEAATLHGVVR
jgi:hypothetical protein